MRSSRRFDTDLPTAPLAEDELRQDLRDMLLRRANIAVPPPLGGDRVELAIRRGRRAHRLRIIMGVGLAAATAVLFGTAISKLAHHPDRPGKSIMTIGDPQGPVSPPPDGPRRQALPYQEPLPADIVLGGSLVTLTGKVIDLTKVGPVESAQWSAEGWLVTSAPNAAGRTLWYIQPNGSPRVLLAGVAAVTLTPDGRQVAWRDGDEIFAAGIVGGTVIATVRTPASGGAVPVGFVGDAVLVSASRGERRQYALWRPGQGPLRLDGNADVLTVYGVLPDKRAVGLVAKGPADQPCLALLDPQRKLSVLQTACALSLSVGEFAAISPDGQWLVANGRPDGPQANESALAVDLTRTFGATSASRPRTVGPSLTGDAAWLDMDTLLYVTEDRALAQVSAPHGMVRLLVMPSTEGKPVVVKAMPRS